MLVFGRTGQVARELAEIAPEARFLSRADADLADPESCAQAIRRIRPSAVVNAAAYTAVDKAEEERDLAFVVNAEAPAAMAGACAELAIPFVHISTDYVFDGTGDEPRMPGDPIDPINAYGASKAAGERAVRESGAVHAILRTSWVFSPYGANFPKTMLRLAAAHDMLRVVADQVGGPTPARAIAHACATMAERLVEEPSLSGTYHLSGTPDVSWADFARAIFAEAGKPVKVADIATSEFPTPAVRPANSKLDCRDLAKFGLERPDWRLALRRVIENSEYA